MSEASNDSRRKGAGGRAQRWQAPLHLHITALFVLLLGAAALALGTVASRSSQALVDEAGRAARLHALSGVLRSVPGISAAYLGWPDGSFVLLRPVGPHAERLKAPADAVWLAQWASPAGARFEFRSDALEPIERREGVDYPFDPRLRPWFGDTLGADEAIVTAPYLFFTTLEPGITAARRAASGAIAGVDVALWELSTRLSVGRLTAEAQAIVLDAAGGVMADADSARLRRLVAARAPTPASPATEILPRAAELGPPVLAQLAELWRNGQARFEGRLDVDGQGWLAVIVPLGLPGTAFAMAAPEAALGQGPNAIRARLLTASGLALLLAVPVIWIVARLVARPVRAFAREAQAVARLEFRDAPRHVSRVRELAELDEAIAAMRTALGGFTAVAHGIVASEQIDPILANTIEALMRAAGADRGAAWLMRDGAMALAVVRPAPDTPPGADGEGRDLAARIGHSAPHLVEAFAPDDPRLGPLAGGAARLAVLGVPLRARDSEVTGAIALACPAPAEHAFPAPILALADAIARPVALAIDRRRLIAAQRASLEQLRLLEMAVSRLTDMVMITADPGGDPAAARIVYVNDAFVRLTGWSREEAIGARPQMLNGPETSREELDRIAAALRRGESARTELVAYTKAGATIRLELDVAPIPDSAGRVSHWVTVERDVTERRKVEERLRQSQKLEALGQLTGGVAHDFNNLLTVILGNAETLADELAGNERLRRLAAMAATAAERGAELTDRLLAFARRRPLEPKVVDLAALLAGMDGLLRQALTKRVELEITAERGLWPALVDPGQLEGAVLNLAINARDAMPKGGRLTIALANASLDAAGVPAGETIAPGDYVVLSVTDTGTGMAPEVAERAFDPFFTTKKVGKGSGLGLSMVYGFVIQSEGHARIETSPGKGTTVRLYLPRAAEPPGPRRRGGADAAPRGAGEHILLVEDDPLVREHTASLLQSLGYRVSTAGNAAEALETLAHRADIDLLFSDIVMPGGMDGRALGEQARRLNPALKVLFASGYAPAGPADDPPGTEAIGLLAKPYRRQELAGRIRAALAAP
jgi:PAS domain S-box-containing protein